MTTPEYTDHQLDSTNSSEVLKESLRFISRWIVREITKLQAFR
jgi:hypothetical protein